MERYLNEAIIGNKQMLVTYTQKGELQRLYYPAKDNRQYISFYHTGVKVNDSDLIYLHDDINNVYKQYYDVNTNILNTEITNTYFNLKVLQTDFVPIKENILVRKYTFINEGSIDLDVSLFVHSEIVSDRNNHVGCKIIDNGMVQYAHDFMVTTIVPDKKVLRHQINGSKNTIKSTNISDKDYIGMSADSCVRSVICFTTLAGRPVAMVHAGTSFVTNEPAPTIAPSPMVTPGMTKLSIPTKQPFFKWIGFSM